MIVIRVIGPFQPQCPALMISVHDRLSTLHAVQCYNVCNIAYNGIMIMMICDNAHLPALIVQTKVQLPIPFDIDTYHWIQHARIT